MDAIPVTFHLTDDERVYVEFCLARRRELLALGDAAPHGKVLARCESATVEIPRQQAHLLLTDAITRRVAAAEKKGHRPESACAVGCGTVGDRMSAPS
jgi:hypothetical protein